MNAVYPTSMYLFRDDYPDRASYLAAFRDCNAYYGYKAAVVGGWIFFQWPGDLRAWRMQK